MRKKGLKLLLASIPVMTLIQSCDFMLYNHEDTMKFEFKNESNHQILIKGEVYLEPNDSLLPSRFVDWSKEFEQTINPGKSKKIDSFYKKNEWQKKYTHQFLVYKQSTLDKYEKEYIMEHDIYDKRYILTYDEVAAGLKIVYTGE